MVGYTPICPAQKQFRNKGESENLQPITRDEMELLIKHGILKCVRGRYPGLITGSKEKHGKGKPRFVEPPIYNQLLKLQEKLKVDK